MISPCTVLFFDIFALSQACVKCLVCGASLQADVHTPCRFSFAWQSLFKKKKKNSLNVKQCGWWVTGKGILSMINGSSHETVMLVQRYRNAVTALWACSSWRCREADFRVSSWVLRKQYCLNVHLAWTIKWIRFCPMPAWNPAHSASDRLNTC